MKKKKKLTDMLIMSSKDSVISFMEDKALGFLQDTLAAFSWITYRYFQQTNW